MIGIKSTIFQTLRNYKFGTLAANEQGLGKFKNRSTSWHRSLAFDIEKYFEQMFGDVFHAQPKAGYAELPNDTTSSHTCTKPTVQCSNT